MNRLHVRKWWLGVALVLCLAQAAPAEQLASTNSSPLQEVRAKSKRKLGRVSKPAEFEGAGLLQFEYGYDGDFHAPDADEDQAGTASVLFNATEDLQFEFDFDTFHAVTSNSNQTTIGIGDAYASAQATMLSETQRHPSLGFAYLVKLPTADQNKGLGTGRTDHKSGFLASKKVKTTDIDFNAWLLINGNSQTHGWETGYQLALGFSHGLTRSLSLQGEIFGETLDTDQPRGLFVQGGLTYQPTTRASLDVGVRAGLTSSAPRFGILAGVSLSLADLYEVRPMR